MYLVLVVLDTCLLVAAWRSRSGASFEILRLLREGEFEIAVSVPLVLEYESALLRHLSGPQTEQDVTAVVDYLCLVARKQEVFFLWRPLLRDPNDDMVAELAVASGAHAVVTHNLSDFVGADRLGVRVLAPSEFLRHLVRR
jgi:putative PIN family toxin of toxin-antitoxin system